MLTSNHLQLQEEEDREGYEDQGWGGSWGDPPLIRYIRNVLEISKVGHTLGKGC